MSEEYKMMDQTRRVVWQGSVGNYSPSEVRIIFVKSRVDQGRKIEVEVVVDRDLMGGPHWKTVPPSDVLYVLSVSVALLMLQLKEAT